MAAVLDDDAVHLSIQLDWVDAVMAANLLRQGNALAQLHFDTGDDWPQLATTPALGDSVSSITDPAQISQLDIRRHPRLGGILNESHRCTSSRVPVLVLGVECVPARRPPSTLDE